MRERIAPVKMVDLQNEIDPRNIPIDWVGIENFKCPLSILDRSRGHQAVNATINIYTNLSGSQRGSNMSRFAQVINENLSNIMDTQYFGDLLQMTRERHQAPSAWCEITFDYFIKKSAPVSGNQAFNWYPTSLFGLATNQGTQIFLETTIPFLSLCPCSKAISRYGAHNQRSHVGITAELLQFVWIEEMVEMAESVASCEIFNILKREDERYVTEKSYETPRFVEDMAREIVLQIQNESQRIGYYRVYCVHQESIHQYNATAVIEGNNSQPATPSSHNHGNGHVSTRRSPLMHLRSIE